jgi:ATP-dependent helicase HrpB
VRETDLAVLPWSERARSLQRRVAFVGRHSDQSWPDLSDRHLRNTLEDWLALLLPGATGREDLVRVEVTTALRARLTAGQVRALERLAPPALTVPSGRSVALDYSEDPPVLAVRVQELFGLAETPTVLGGRLPVVLHLLSPANRPIQITRDLAGFWAGTWADVRKEMAGRYPKHPWPVDPVTASPVRR